MLWKLILRPVGIVRGKQKNRCIRQGAERKLKANIKRFVWTPLLQLRLLILLLPHPTHVVVSFFIFGAAVKVGCISAANIQHPATSAESTTAAMLLPWPLQLQQQHKQTLAVARVVMEGSQYQQQPQCQYQYQYHYQHQYQYKLRWQDNRGKNKMRK